MLSNTSFWNHLRFRLGGWEKYLFSHSCRTQCAMCLDCSGCHQKKKGSLAYISIQFCWTSTILNDQEIVKLVKKCYDIPNPEEQLYDGQDLGTRPHHLQVQRLLSVTERHFSLLVSLHCDAEQSSAAHWATSKRFLQWVQHFCQSTSGHRSHQKTAVSVGIASRYAAWVQTVMETSLFWMIPLHRHYAHVCGSLLSPAAKVCTPWQIELCS